MASSLDKLVDDIVIQIFQVLSVRTVLALRKVGPSLFRRKHAKLKGDETSRRYYILSKLHCVWYARFRVDVLARNLPPPGPPYPLTLLSAAELEQRTLRAVYLEQAWPRLSASTLVSRDRHHEASLGRVDQVMFLPGGTDILTVQDDEVVHWHIVGWPGFTHGLKHVGEWTPFEGVQCRIVKDSDVPGVIAVGPRELMRSQRFAKVLSTSLKAPFVTLCDYERVPGIVAGVWRHLLLLDVTGERGEGGLSLLDWHAQTTGTALLPCLPDLFGNFLDFVVFADHLLVVWEYCMSVFPVPHVPRDGRLVVEHKRVYMFQEAISRPIGLTTCVAQRVVPPCSNANIHLDHDTDWDMNWNRDGQLKRRHSSSLDMSPTLTIAARLRRRPESVSMVMVIPLVHEEGYEGALSAYTDTFPYRLSYLPLPSPSTPPWQYYANQGGEPEGDEEDGGGISARCTSLCLGSSGRGVFVVGRELRLVSPGLHILPPYDMQVGPVFETGDAIYRVDRPRKRDLNWLHLEEDGAGEGSASGGKVDFDEGMGRFVVAKERGGFEVVQLD